MQNTGEKTTVSQNKLFARKEFTLYNRHTNLLHGKTDHMKKHTSTSGKTSLAFTIAVLMTVFVFALSSCAKKEKESDVTTPASDTSASETETTEPTSESATEDTTSETATEPSESASESETEEPGTSVGSADFIQPETTPAETTASGKETTKATKKPTSATTKATAKETKATETTSAPKETEAPKPKGEASSSGAETLMNLINEKRAEAGVPALSVDSNMNKGARIRAQEMSQNYNDYKHTRPNGDPGMRVLIEVGCSYTAAAENAGRGQSSVSEIFNSWMSSNGHKKNMLNEKYSKMGLGYYTVSGTTYWCLLLMN